MNKTIFHIDFDSYFASCEQHFNPNLRNRPIGVTAENGRTCIIAASREAKKFGVKTGTRSWEAKQLCPEIVLVKADFERYLEITKKFIQIASNFSPIVEVFSLDEVFIDMTPTLHLFSPVIARNEVTKQSQARDRFAIARDDNLKRIMNAVKQFKQKLREEVGTTITVSIGVSYNKLLAKLATGINKPDGFAIIDKSNKDKIFANIELTDVCGIGERYKRRLNLLGIFTFKQLEEYPMHLLKKEFGNVASQNLKRMAMGVDDSPVISYTEDTVTKSVGRNYCLPQNEYDQNKILQTMYELSEEIAIKLRRLNMKGRTVGLYLSGEKFEHGRKTFQKYTNLGQDIYEGCLYLYKKWKWNSMVRQMGVWTGNLIDEQYSTIPMFENPKKDDVTKVMDLINERFGHHTIRNGFLTYAPKLHTKPNGYLADKTIRRQLRTI